MSRILPEQTCEVCWTNSWVPVPDDDPDAQKLLKEKGSVRCDHCWLQKRYRELEQKVERLLANERAEVLAACIHATCVLCRTGEKSYLQSFGGKNWKGRYQAWVHDVKIEGRLEVQTCQAGAMHSLQPAAKDLEELLEKVELEALRNDCNEINVDSQCHTQDCWRCRRIAELEKARASEGKG